MGKPVTVIPTRYFILCMTAGGVLRCYQRRGEMAAAHHWLTTLQRIKPIWAVMLSVKINPGWKPEFSVEKMEGEMLA